MSSNFEPKIIAFCCNWSSYPVVSDAKPSDVRFATNVKFIKMMCGGMITAAFILKAFELGADGVLVATCHVEDCHYITGARRAVDVYENTEKLVDMLGIEKERLKLESFSSNETAEFENATKAFIETIRKIGPSSIKKKNTDKSVTASSGRDEQS